MKWTPPSADQLLAMMVNAGMAELATHERFSAASADLVQAIVEGVGQFAAGKWAPLNRIGDEQGARIQGGTVVLPPGFEEAYSAFVEQGWNAVSGPEAFGGQGLPFTMACCVLESLGSANLGFALLPMLTVGAIEALHHHGSDAQKAMYLTKLVSGEWPGTMNLTEPQAGSDVGALRTAAMPITEGEHAGKFHIKGTKIFISWGEHELADNIVHLVLARTPGAPEGSRGISLFVVPKFLVNTDGSIGTRNDLRVLSVEHKLGIRISPTCVMSYGENDACIGELVGDENAGLRYMFTMMNSARINVGSQGVQVAEAALQRARRFAAERVQSSRAGAQDRKPVAIIEHPDVRRMLLRMQSLTEGARALLYYTAGQVDRAALGLPGAQDRADILVPLLKAWATDVGCEVASLGVQIHGGMGFIEETGAAQPYRDARITSIYEGTNGIQAGDFVTRKMGLRQGRALAELLAEAEAAAVHEPALADLAIRCSSIADWMRDEASLDDRLAGSVPFLTMCAVVVAGWQMLLQAQWAAAIDPEGAKSKLVPARFFIGTLVPEAAGLESAARQGASLLYELDSVQLTRLAY